MALYFKTYASSSSGNCLALWTDRTAVLIDCGLGTMKRTRAVLADMAAIAPPVSAVIISHLHSDHVAYYPLRVLEQALTELDDQRSWPQASHSLDQLLLTLQRSQSRG